MRIGEYKRRAPALSLLMVNRCVRSLRRFFFVVDDATGCVNVLPTMSKRHEKILGSPELFRALLKLEGFDGYEIDRARLEYRWHPEKYAGAFVDKPINGDLIEFAEGVERFE